jgi:chemotaxis response regulator CheB
MREGRVDALLEEHTSRLNKINGSVDRFAKSNEDMTKAMREMQEKLHDSIRGIEEQMRLDAERVKVAAETLATETERRREELADSVVATTSRWSLRSNKASVISVGMGVIALLVSVAIHYL